MCGVKACAAPCQRAGQSRGTPVADIWAYRRAHARPWRFTIALACREASSVPPGSCRDQLRIARSGDSGAVCVSLSRLVHLTVSARGAHLTCAQDKDRQLPRDLGHLDRARGGRHMSSGVRKPDAASAAMPARVSTRCWRGELMKAMVLDRPGERLRLAELPVPEPGDGQILVRVRACAVCRTDLHVVDGELPEPKLPLVPGHEIVGEVARAGPGADRFRAGRARRHSLARLHLRPVSVLSRRPGEPVRSRRASPAIRSTADTPSTRSRMPAIVFRSRGRTPTTRRRRCCAPG